MSEYFLRSNSNRGGSFATARISDEVIDTARRRMADFVNAAAPEEIVFGQNMTSLTFQMTRALAPSIAPGDEILVTRMDHDANVTPRRLPAERAGATIKWLDFSRDTFRYDLDDLDRLLSSKTKIAAVNYASNVTGTINDVGEITRRVTAAGGLPMSMRCSSPRMAPSMFGRLAAIFSSARPTNSTAPMPDGSLLSGLKTLRLHSDGVMRHRQ